MHSGLWAHLENRHNKNLRYKSHTVQYIYTQTHKNTHIIQGVIDMNDLLRNKERNKNEMQRRMKQRWFKEIRNRGKLESGVPLLFCYKIFCLPLFGAFHTSYISASVSLFDVCG